MLYVVVVCEFFFFKQKTAYEMRISDWSSDVCSSDLIQPYPGNTVAPRSSAIASNVARKASRRQLAARQRACGCGRGARSARSDPGCTAFAAQSGLATRVARCGCTDARSEEHTSELQSLMRNSSAVFCLKKKKPSTHNTKH